jgi:hypothetical protein
MKLPDELDIAIFKIKAALWFNVLWGILAVFVCAGFLMKKGELALFAAIVVSLSWVLTNMISGGVKSFAALQILKTAEQEKSDAEKRNEEDK